MLPDSSLPLSDESEALEGCTAAALSHAELTLPSRLDHVHLVQNFIRDLCQLLGATARPFAQLPLADHRSRDSKSRCARGWPDGALEAYL